MDAIQQRSANLQPLNGTQQLSHAQSHPCINSTKWHNVSNGNSSYLENGWSQPPVHHHPAAYSQQNPPQPMQRRPMRAVLIQHAQLIIARIMNVSKLKYDYPFLIFRCQVQLCLNCASFSCERISLARVQLSRNNLVEH
ncbi:unnamed protein product [Nesidiocoris tenuis]|uniref:Uncharacterized protein n=1 Tax=Nesidiocoris tenuis TaxID=355587 RepID=A0A6H5GV58_9HEMI|nr:unnamed protein product [Nesidiocoris tenuis]